jgi:hypothetical protein
MLKRFFLICMLVLPALLGSARMLPAQSLDGVISAGEYDFSAAFDDGGFTVSWKTAGDKAFFALSAATRGWVALGLEPVTAMEAADMLIGWVTAGGDVTVLDCWSTGPFGPHAPDITLGGSSDLLGAAGSESDGRTILEFSRSLSTGDEYDRDIPAAGELRILWAYGDEDLPETLHTSRGSGVLKMAAGRAEVRDPGWLVAAHALALSLSFACMLAGMLISRYLKKKRWWLKVHRVLGVSGVVLGVGGVAAMTVMLSLLSASHMRILHSYLGLLTLTGMLAAPVLGQVMLKIRGGRKTLRTVHRWLGRLVLLLMAATVLLGLVRIGLL